MKKCIKCGQELPDEAAFCPGCETAQREPEPVKPPRVWRRKTLIACVTLAALLVIAATLYAVLRPRVYDSGGPELTYRGYHVLATFQVKGEPRAAERSRTSTVPSHADYAYPAQIYIYRDNDTRNAREAFMEQVAYVSLSAQARDGAKKMEYDDPAYEPAFPDAAQLSSIYYDSTCGTNDITWTIRMKNGDQLILHQSITVIPQPEKTFYSADYDMTTMEALRTLLDEIEATEPPETLVSIYLPPVTYRGKLTLHARAYYFYGSSDGSGTTTFTDTVTVETETPIHTEFHSVRFAGRGGTGLFVSRGVTIEQCSFTGWDVAATASDGGWLGVHNCEFSNNGVGLQYNTGDSKLTNLECEDCSFTDNGIAVHFVRVPTKLSALHFNKTLFRGNGENIRNESHIEADLSQAILE